MGPMSPANKLPVVFGALLWGTNMGSPSSQNGRTTRLYSAVGDDNELCFVRTAHRLAGFQQFHLQ
jgi:hypothetical protein